MKKSRTKAIRYSVLALVVVFSGIHFNSMAQFGLAVGPKAGLSVSTFRGDVESADARVGWLGGLLINAQITPSITIQPELLFTQRGGEYRNNDRFTDIEINYFEVPVLVKLRLPIDDVVFPNIVVGPNFSYRTNLRYSSTDTGDGTAISVSESDIRKSDVGALIGAGIDLQTRESGLFFTLDGRYMFGFNDINTGDNTFEVQNAGWTFAVGVGFLFRR